MRKHCFLHSDTSWARIGTTQTTIRIWSELELEARHLIITASREACDLVEFRLEEKDLREPVRWLETAAAKGEFSNVSDGWEDFDMVPDGWKPQDLKNEEPENVPDGCKNIKMKFRFKQESIKKYFSSQKAIDFDEEI